MVSLVPVVVGLSAHRSSLAVITFLCMISSCVFIDAQVILPMNVCYKEGALGIHVQEFCRSVPECNPAAGEGGGEDNCFMRCDEPQLGESNFICEDYGMICYYSKICEVPPLLLEEDDDGTTDMNENGGDITTDVVEDGQ